MMYCECGCGELTSLEKQSETRRGVVKGQPRRFVYGHNHRAVPRAKGYITRYVTDHPKASPSGCVYLHVLVAERALGHYLPEGAHVHHVDENKQNNANRNLVICQDLAYHYLLHYRARIVKAGGDPDTQRICSLCKQLLLLSAFNRMRGNKGMGFQTGCRSCLEQTRRSRKIRARLESFYGVLNAV